MEKKTANALEELIDFFGWLHQARFEIGPHPRSPKCASSGYAAAFAAIAGSVLDVIVPLRPVGKKPPCVAPGFPPNAR
jgi:hypothetical protein